MSCTQTRVSVSSEVNNASLIMFVNSALGLGLYYFTAHERNDDVSSICAACFAVTNAIIYISFHRMDVSRIKLQITSGEGEWNTSLYAHTASTVVLLFLIHLLVSSEPHPFDYVQHAGTWCMDQPWQWERMHPGGEAFARLDDEAWCEPNFGNVTELCLAYSGPLAPNPAVRHLIHAQTWDRWKAVSPSLVFMLISATTLLQATSFVYLRRFGNAADDQYAVDKDEEYRMLEEHRKRKRAKKGGVDATTTATGNASRSTGVCPHCNRELKFIVE